MELHVFGRGFGLPDPSPFCIKAIILMEMSGLPYRRVRGNLLKAPKGKLPVLRDGDRLIPDSSFIRMHLEQGYGIDFDEGLSAEQRGVAWAVEKMVEDHLYWLVVQERWLDAANFDRGPRRFFDAVPAPLRPLMVAMVKRQVRRDLRGQGVGRHNDAERLELARRDLDALDAILGDKPYLGGAAPCGGDATVGAFLVSGLCEIFDSPVSDALREHGNLVAYAGRMGERYLKDQAA
ncbi:glutathione S-transferase family protein [Bosea sp. CS1GBMeth4]|uniref:glutathione S-transferase family protein n=1 Tax=Bosea sp. CS1GBMeth4 TaxID=1892849 RepID=UPI001FCEF6D7|nr:glutathione S-transferase family protein [Bosea sp. CS1GBMeth4]